MLTRKMWWLKLREHVSGGKLETTIVARVNMAPRPSHGAKATLCKPQINTDDLILFICVYLWFCGPKKTTKIQNGVIGSRSQAMDGAKAVLCKP